MQFIVRAILKVVDRAIVRPVWNARKRRIDRQKAEEDTKLRAELICNTCQTPVEQGARFCGKCGGASFVKRGTLLNKAEAERQLCEATKRQEKAAQKRRKEAEVRLEYVRKHCASFASLKHCNRCDAALDSGHDFCPTCGTKTEVIPLSFAFQFAHNQFPEEVPDEDTFRRILRKSKGASAK